MDLQLTPPNEEDTQRAIRERYHEIQSSLKNLTVDLDKLRCTCQHPNAVVTQSVLKHWEDYKCNDCGHSWVEKCEWYLR